jgi:type II secretory ATPase GspE/PulE/Tfp pilus assembly ATPase PilB-like protein
VARTFDLKSLTRSASAPAAPARAAGAGERERPAGAATSSAVAKAAPRGRVELLSNDAMQAILLSMGVRASHVQVALQRKRQTGEPLAQIMRDFGFLSGEQVAQAVSQQTRFDYFGPERLDEIDVRELQDLHLPEFNHFVPVGREADGRLVIAVPDAEVVSSARNAFLNDALRIVVASEHTIQTVYRRYFARTETAFDLAVEQFMSSVAASRRRDEDDFSAGYVRDVFFTLLRHACYAGASDLYLYKSEYVGIVKLKVNGVGSIFRTLDLLLYDRLLNKLVQENTKAEDLRRRPKESVVEFSEEDRERHADIANRFGFRLELTESRGVRNAVIRILDKNAAATDLDRLGFDAHTFASIERIARTSTGFFLVTGPTGSGKTTTLYAVLKSIDPVERSIQSIENPIEYKHGLWQQYELRKDATNEGEEYNEWLKALLRNAPDVILVGEVRDRDVANICLNAANTGHLVFATLHTNNAVLALARLKMLEVDLNVLGSVLLGILAQRLVRVLCKDCKQPDDSPATRAALTEPYLGSLRKHAFRAGAGCPNCEFTGYRGRRMLYELLEISPTVRQAIEANESPSQIARQGLAPEHTMWASGLRMVAEGVTSFEELQRVAQKEY